MKTPAKQQSGTPLRRLMTIPVVLYAWLLPAAGLCEAVDDTTRAGYSGLPGAEFNFFWSVFKVGFALLITTVMIVAAVWLLKRLAGPRIGGGAGQTVTIVDMTYLAPKKAIVLVRVLERIFIVGMTDETFSTLGELTPEEAARLGEGEPVTDTPFSSILSGFSRRSPKNG